MTESRRRKTCQSETPNKSMQICVWSIVSSVLGYGVGSIAWSFYATLAMVVGTVLLALWYTKGVSSVLQMDACLAANPELQPARLLPALLRYAESSKQSPYQTHALRYVNFCLERSHSQHPAVHELAVGLSNISNPQLSRSPVPRPCRFDLIGLNQQATYQQDVKERTSSNLLNSTGLSGVCRGLP